MVLEHTQQQSTDEQARAQALSLKRSQPPAQVPGYEARRFLGAGAYGEVWVAIDRNTGRQVAIKYYAHRGGLDWSLLSREVEKLAFLSADRYVVQLLDVGWEAEPPYYVMEYVERGSLEDLLKREGKLPPRQAAALFQEIAVGLLHAHAKGVLHCDLKPANVLLDQDAKPRLADFGQSRLSHEQTPALGTLFYMAPEQADLKAVPDVHWDVYALGSLLYCMLTGAPPYRTDHAVTEIETARDLDERLVRYRQLIETSPRPTAHRHLRGVDRALADIVDGCLAPDRNERFANVQEVLNALEDRERQRAQRSLLVLAAVGPALVLAVVSLCAWWWFETVLHDSDEELRARAQDSNRYAAQYVAKAVTNELERRYQAVEDLTGSHRFQELLAKVIADPKLTRLRTALADPKLTDAERGPLRGQLIAHPARQALQQRLQDLFNDDSEPSVASWFVTDPNGVQLARAPDSSTVGIDFAWRSYFHGHSNDEPVNWRPRPDEHVTDTNLSAVFPSQATDKWSVAISAPVQTDDQPSKFLGIVAVSTEVGLFVPKITDSQTPEENKPKPFAVLVDGRGNNKGLILQHPLYDKLGKIPDRFREYRVKSEQLPDRQDLKENYVDPLGADPEGKEFDQHWLAASSRVSIRDGNTGWVVIVQESYDTAIGRVLGRIKSNYAVTSLLALTGIVLLSTAWGFVIRALGEPSRRAAPALRTVEPAGE